MDIFSHWRRTLVWPPLLSFCLLSAIYADANPTGGTVAHGSATFNTSGSTFNINQSSANAFINWSTFNIGAGETVNFNQPSSSSVTWNQINDPNPSQILGSLNANGYVILQNSSGFVVGGQASLTAHGLIMTTASTPALDLAGSGPWSFDAPPPTAKIVNYGQINITGGGSAWLIANDVENDGTISAPGGKIGLYAGEQVLLSMSPDGRGLSAQATIPQGMVDNNGNLVADAGNITLQAQMVNQNGLIQANSIQNVNGTIQLVAGDSVNLGANSTISAQGDSQGVSSGGSVTVQGGNSFSDQAGSTINISGGAQGGDGGQVEMSAPVMGAINSLIVGQALDGFNGGIFTIDPVNIVLSSSDIDPLVADGYTMININALSGMSQINLEANNNITLDTAWNLADRSAPAALRLTAGNDITLNNSISAGNNWTLNLTAGTAYSGTTAPASGQDGIYLEGNTYLQTQNGDLNVWAANEVLVANGGITTANGGSINVTAEFGNVNSGTGTAGFDYEKTAPYQKPDSQLGGISTANGGNVNINAGGNVISFSAATAEVGSTPGAGDPDPGSGCFGAAAGNVTINAGGYVSGCFVVMNGQGTINAQNIGTSLQNVALSLETGGWTLNAQNNIYLQEVRNPNGLYNETTVSQINGTPTAANHFFNYSPEAYVNLSAGNAVNITGLNLPRNTGNGVPLLLPPIVSINAGPGGVVLDLPTAYDQNNSAVSLSDDDITLFPSVYQSLDITTTGGGWLSSGSANGTVATLLMSDSGYSQWVNNSSTGGIARFGEEDHASVPLELFNNDPVTIDLTGSQLVNGVPVAAGMENVTLQTDKATRINVAGDMIGCSFYGQNLHPWDVTSITVGGQIYNAGSFTSITLAQLFPAGVPAADTPLSSESPAPLSSWYLALALAVNLDPSSQQLTSLLTQNFTGYQPSQILTAINSVYANVNSVLAVDTVYNPSTKTFIFVGPMSSAFLNALESPTLTLIRYNADGTPALNSQGNLETDTINWMPANSPNLPLLASLYTASQNSVTLGGATGYYAVGGTGQFNVTAGSISLGNSGGILSVGDDNDLLEHNYSYLAPYFTSAANVDVNAGYIEMPASTIACVGNGGSVTVNASGEIPVNPLDPLNNNGIGVSMDLGSQELAPFEDDIMSAKNLGLGIYTTGGGNVDVTAAGTINIDTSRVATFDGGDINVESLTGDINAGSGGTVPVPVNYFAPNYFGTLVEDVPANGIIAATLTGGNKVPPGAVVLPGNISVETPEGSIIANLGGVSQIAYNEVLTPSSGSSTISLTAGSPGYIGNLDLGDSGVIGINVNAQASGNINGLIISQQNANIDAAGNFAGTVFSGGKTTLATGGTASGTIVAAGGLNASGGSLTASVFSTSVNGGAGTLATTATASTTSTSAANQTSSQAQQQVASNSSDDDDKKKKKKGLLRTIGRVTVILNSAS